MRRGHALPWNCKRQLWAVVGRLLRDEHVMDVTLALTCIAHPDELRALAQLEQGRRTDVTHAGLQPADELLDVGPERSAMRHAALDPLRHQLAAIGHVMLAVSIAHAFRHRTERPHPAVKFVSPPLVKNRLARTF